MPESLAGPGGRHAMGARRATTLGQRQAIWERVQAGQSYRTVAAALGLSVWTVRKWARQGRRAGLAGLAPKRGRPRTGPLARCSPLVRYRVLRWKKQHPGWGAAYIAWKLGQ